MLDRIEADRERLLAGERLDEPGEFLKLRLALDAESRLCACADSSGEAAAPAERGEGGGRNRTHACARGTGDDGAAGSGRGARPAAAADASAAADAGLELVLRSDLAPASVDTILEIFRDSAHMRVPGFCGEAGGTVVDLGANEGFYALRLKLLNPSLQIVAAEPLAEHVDLIRRNVERNGVNGVQTFEAAIAAVNTEAGESAALETYPSVGTIASTDLQRLPRPWIKRDHVQRRTVPAMSLRDLLDRTGTQRAELLKIDIEGSEPELLESDPPAIRRAERIVVECHGEESRRRCRAALTAAGFECVHAERHLTGDLYFTRNA